VLSVAHPPAADSIGCPISHKGEYAVQNPINDDELPESCPKKDRARATAIANMVNLLNNMTETPLAPNYILSIKSFQASPIIDKIHRMELRLCGCGPTTVRSIMKDPNRVLANIEVVDIENIHLSGNLVSATQGQKPEDTHTHGDQENEEAWRPWSDNPISQWPQPFETIFHDRETGHWMMSLRKSYKMERRMSKSIRCVHGTAPCRCTGRLTGAISPHI
jgi:hypothetical protein